MPRLDPGIHQSHKSFAKVMDCRVKPGNDEMIQNRVTISVSAGRGRSSLGFDGVPM
jgi:hypothetical protein